MDLGKRHEFLRLHRKDIISNMDNAESIKELENLFNQLDAVNKEMADIKIAYLNR